MLLSVYALSNNSLKGHIEVITSLSWTHRMQEVGDMALEVPYSPQADQLLVPGNYVMLPGDAEAMLVTNKTMTRDGNGVARLQVQGQTFMALLGRRLIRGNHAATETPGAALYWLIYNHVCADTTFYAYAYPGATVNNCADITTTKAWMFAWFDNVLDTVRNTLGESGYGLKVLTTPLTPEHAFTVYSPSNRTVDGGGSPVIFCPQNGTAHVTSYTESVDNYANRMWYTIKGSGSTLTTHSAVTRDYATLQGYEVYEAYFRDTNTGTADNYMSAQASAEFQNYDKEYTIEVELHPDCHYLFGTDYDAGTIVTVRDPEFGIDMNATITEVTRTWQGSSPMTTSITLGTGMPRLERRITAAIRAGR